MRALIVSTILLWLALSLSAQTVGGNSKVGLNARFGSAPIPPTPVITRVNSVSWSTDTSNHGTNVFPAMSVTAGNLIVISGAYGADSLPIVADNLNTVWTIEMNTYDSTNGDNMFTIWGIPTSTGSDTIGVGASLGSTPGFWALLAQQYSSSVGWPTNPVDAEVSTNTACSTAANNINSSTKQFGNQYDLIVANVRDTVSASASFTAGSSPIAFNTIRFNANGFGVEDSVGVSITPGAHGASFTSGTATTVLVEMIAFSPTATAGSRGFPNFYCDFENGANGNALTPAILTSSSHGGVGTWSGSTSPLTAMSIVNAGERMIITPHPVWGVTYNDFGGTRGVKFDVSVTTSQYAEVDWRNRTEHATIGMWFYVDILTSDTGFYSMSGIGNTQGSDAADVNVNSGNIFLETPSNPAGNPQVGSFFSYSRDTWYWLVLNFQGRKGGLHSLYIFDTSGNLLNTQSKTNGNVQPDCASVFHLGRLGDSGTPANFIYYDDLLIDTENMTDNPITP